MISITPFDVITGCNFLPLWEISEEVWHPTTRSTTKRTIIRSGISFDTVLKIQNGNSLGRFRLPLLGVVWTPNANLSGWVGQFQVNHVCSGGRIAIPWQYPNISPPAQKPTSSQDRVHLVHANVVLDIAISDCPGYWEASSVSVSSDFGYATTIPYSLASGSGFNDEQSLGTQPPCPAGCSFARTYTFHWSRSSFQYDTGESPNLYYNQTATLVQSPATSYDQMIATPSSGIGG